MGVRQRVKLTGTGIFTPAENSEINTAASVSVSSSADCLSGLKWKRFKTMGPTTIPTAR